jgi:magnesium chelatase family protein
MVARVVTVAFQGVEARRVEVEVQFTGGQAGTIIVGLGDKAVGESRERVRGAFAGLGLALPGRRIVVNLAPADLPKEGSHYDVPIALGMLAAMGVVPPDALNGWAAIGELSLDGRLAPVAGVLPAAVAAQGMGLGLICPEANGPEAAWAGEAASVLAPRSLIALINHFRGVQVLGAPRPGPMLDGQGCPDLRDVKGQEGAKRALEIAAAGGHNLFLSMTRGPSRHERASPTHDRKTCSLWNVSAAWDGRFSVRLGSAREVPTKSAYSPLGRCGLRTMVRSSATVISPASKRAWTSFRSAMPF